MYKLLLIAIGGAAGTLARYGAGMLLARASEKSLFPFGTLAVNLVGCFLIGYLQGLFASRLSVSVEVQLMILIGFLGGYTTFSTFGWETASFLRDGQYVAAAINLMIHNVLGVTLVIVGYGVSRLHA